MLDALGLPARIRGSGSGGKGVVGVRKSDALPDEDVPASGRRCGGCTADASVAGALLDSVASDVFGHPAGGAA